MLLQLLLFHRIHTGIAVCDDDGFVEAVVEDVLGDAVEVCAVGGADVTFEQVFERCLDDFVAELVDCGQLVSYRFWA